MKKMHEHIGWIKQQFKLQNTTPSYRNVLVHAGLIENIIEKEARCLKSFSTALKILRFSGQYIELDKVEDLRKLRNRIVHKIGHDELNEKQINQTRDKIHVLLKEIYSKNPLIRKYFKDEYNVDTKDF